MSVSTHLNDHPALKRLLAIATSPDVHARQWKSEKGSPVVGTFCSYVPEEVILAGGALPFRILSVKAEFGRADNALQTYACCLARGALESLMTGAFDFLDGVVFSNTCDTMQCLADIWPMHAPKGWVETFMPPVHVGHRSARQYLIAETRRLIESLRTRGGLKIDDDSLRQAIAECRTARNALSAVYERQRGPSPILSPREFYGLTLARWFLPPAEYAAAVQEIICSLTPTSGTRPRIFVMGGPMLDSSLSEVLTELDAHWVGDDLCTGGRACQSTGKPPDDPVEAIADRLLARRVCPAKHLGTNDPGQSAVQLARQAGADGVIVWRLKFCDPHGFDYPRVKEALDAAGLPHVLIEVESSAGAQGQLRTRLQAFLEMLTAAAVGEKRP